MRWQISPRCRANSGAGKGPAPPVAASGSRLCGRGKPLRCSRLACIAVSLLLLLAACGPADAPEPSQPAESPVPSETASPSPSPPAAPAAPALALAWDPDSPLDPLKGNTVNLMLAPLVFEGLFALDEGFEPQPVLCESYTQSLNELSWTFMLRPDIVFSDGTPLTGAIAARCLNAARGSSLYSARLSAVASVRAGEGSVTVELSRPCGTLPTLLDVPIFLTQEEGLPLGTGPYCFEEAAGELRLSAVPGWWQGRTLPALQIPLRQTPSTDDQIAAFDTGRITLVDTDFNATNALGYSSGYDAWDYPTSSMIYVGFNLRNGPCADAALRLAAARCLDRESMAAVTLAGHADAASLPMHPNAGLYDKSLAQGLAYDPQAAALALAEAGWQADEEGRLVKNRQRLELNVLVSSENPARAALAEALAAELEKLGADVTVTRLAWENYLKALEKGDFDLYIAQVKLSANFDPTVLLEGALNYGGNGDGELAAILSNYRAASGDARTWLSYALFARLTAHVPIAPICFTRGTVLTQWGRVLGLTPVQGNVFYKMEEWVLA